MESFPSSCICKEISEKKLTTLKSNGCKKCSSLRKLQKYHIQHFKIGY